MSENRPLVSIGMPVYNGEKFIREALDSLLGQTLIDFELIISDNASIDATALICRNYAEKDSRIRYIRQQKNLGPFANFQFVLNESNAEYFMWAACDDKWSLDWLEKLYQAIKEEEVGMVFGNIIQIDDKGVLIEHPANGKTFCYYDDNTLMRRISFYLAYEGMGKANSIYSLYKRDMIQLLNSLWKEMIENKCFYDYTIMYNCLQKKKLKAVKGVTLFKRIHAGSEGTEPSDHEKSMVFALIKKIMFLIWPFPPKLMMDYFYHSTSIEKIILLLLSPVKLLIAYYYSLKKIGLRFR